MTRSEIYPPIILLGLLVGFLVVDVATGQYDWENAVPQDREVPAPDGEPPVVAVLATVEDGDTARGDTASPLPTWEDE